jgi:hypothetical protein
MLKYCEGQEVEVMWPSGATWIWRKAKIMMAKPSPIEKEHLQKYNVEFPDGIYAVFDTDHIRHPLDSIKDT